MADEKSEASPRVEAGWATAPAPAGGLLHVRRWLHLSPSTPSM